MEDAMPTMKERITTLFLRLLCVLVAVGLGSVALDLVRDWQHGVPDQDKVAILVGAHLCVVGACVALLFGLAKAAEVELHKALAVLRQTAVLLVILCAAAALVSCLIVFAGAMLREGQPPLHWRRIGGVTSDWVIDVAVVLPLLLLGVAGAAAGFFQGVGELMAEIKR
jgi:hypothetical protein